jgi:CobQ-like glutamine amidotransferase family enzyme
MGTVRIGRGNNGRDRTEGAIYRNAIGCYLHGSLLPKNPVVTDWLIEQSLRRRIPDFTLDPISNDLEARARETAIERAVVTR